MQAPREERQNDDALELILWYQKQPRHMTMKTDREIAVDLGWAQPRRERQAMASRRDNRGLTGVLRLADFNRVRRTRRFVDQNKTEWADYWFGTRKNGRGGAISSLNSPELDVQDDSADSASDHIRAQVQRTFQSFSQHRAEVGRIVAKLDGYEKVFVDAGDFEAATALALAVSELRRADHESLTGDTVHRLVEAGLFPS